MVRNGGQAGFVCFAARAGAPCRCGCGCGWQSAGAGAGVAVAVAVAVGVAGRVPDSIKTCVVKAPVRLKLYRTCCYSWCYARASKRGLFLPLQELLHHGHKLFEGYLPVAVLRVVCMDRKEQYSKKWRGPGSGRGHRRCAGGRGGSCAQHTCVATCPLLPAPQPSLPPVPLGTGRRMGHACTCRTGAATARAAWLYYAWPQQRGHAVQVHTWPTWLACSAARQPKPAFCALHRQTAARTRQT